MVWALGHLVTLADPELYDDKYKTWKMEDLPMLPAKMDLVVMKETSKQFGMVKNLMKSPEIDDLIIAPETAIAQSAGASYSMLLQQVLS